MRQEYKERSERLELATMERSLTAGSVPCGQFLMEILAPRELCQTTEMQVPTAPGRNGGAASEEPCSSWWNRLGGLWPTRVCQNPG